MSQFLPLKERLDRIIAILERFERRLPLQSEEQSLTVLPAQVTTTPPEAVNTAAEPTIGPGTVKRRGRPPNRGY